MCRQAVLVVDITEKNDHLKKLIRREQQENVQKPWLLWFLKLPMIFPITQKKKNRITHSDLYV